jgi:rod shape determining protein RodA
MGGAVRLRAPEGAAGGSWARDLRLAIDPWIAGPAVIILGFALAALFSVVYHPVAFEINPELATDLSTPFTKQLLWGVLGIIGMTLVAFVDLDRLRSRSNLVYLGGVVLLVAVLLAGVKVRNIRAWLSIGGFTFQPSELVKVALILSLARYLSRPGASGRPFVSLAASAVLVGIPAALVLEQPDMGTVIVYLSLLLTVPFAAGLPSRYLIVALIAGVLAGCRLLVGLADAHLHILPEGVLSTFLQSPEMALRVFLILAASGTVVAALMTLFRMRHAFTVWLYSAVPAGAVYASFLVADHLKEYQTLRLLSFIAPQLDPKGSGYNIIQSQIAFGSGGLFGKGFQGATQSALGFLPERQTDFIFSVIGEVFGLVGVAIVLGSFLLLCLRILWIASQARDAFGALIATGVATVIVTHVVVNVGMAIGITPIMGIPLPLASYGGTAMVAVFLMLGLVLAVERDFKV